MLKRNRLEKMDITAGADSADLYQVCFSFPIRANDQICEENQKSKKPRKTFGFSQELLMLFTNRGRWIDQTALLLAVHE